MSTTLLACAGAQVPGLQAPAPPVRTPELQADGRVTFRFRAPKATEVLLLLEGSQPLPMTTREGLWTVTTSPLAPDWYGYSFLSDGLEAIDPLNPLLKPNLLHPQNILHLPGPASLPWETADVPHGVLHRHFYKSGIVGDERDLFVYTPPGYDPSAASSYPVLYLLHGFSDDASGWTAVGRAHVILDNLIAAGRARPMIAVMPLGYGAPEILTGGFAGFYKDRALLQRNFDKFREALLGEVLPRVESAYRTAGGRDSRAIAGLSMGGSESLLTGLNTPDDFAWIGAFSSGGLSDDFATQFPHLDREQGRRVRLLFISCGTDDHLIDINRRLRAWLASKGVDPIGVESAGGHDWMVWRRNLVEFVALLFR